MPRHVAFLLVTAAACSSGAAAVRPAAPTYAGAVGERCAVGDPSPQPLVVDWRPEARADLEVAMRRGVAVVAYDCHQLRVLPDCTVAGGYDFVAVTPKEEQIDLKDADEIRANLPAGVASASLARDASLDVHLSIVGKQMARAGALERAQLRGRCEGATHFVRAVTTGAFSLATHTDAALDGGATMHDVGAKSRGSSDWKVTEADGDPAACRGVAVGTSAPLASCASPLRLDLVAIAEGPEAPAAPAAADDGVGSAQPPAPRCPAGLAWSAGACRHADQPHACTGGVDDCRRQCELGNAVSCTDLGMEYLVGRVVPLDRAAATGWFERACRAGEPYGCSDLGFMLLVGPGVAHDPVRARALFDAACNAEPRLCANPAAMYRDGLSVAKDPARSAEMFSRACLGGLARACHDLAIAYDAGAGVGRDPARAAELQADACAGKYMRGCAATGVAYLSGAGVPLDEATAVAYFRTACSGGDPVGCSMLGYATIEGIGGLAKDPRAGREMMVQACHTDPGADSCGILSALLRTQGDEVGARAYAKRACDAGHREACEP
jgi:TPR repeat protein